MQFSLKDIFDSLSNHWLAPIHYDLLVKCNELNTYWGYFRKPALKSYQKTHTFLRNRGVLKQTHTTTNTPTIINALQRTSASDKKTPYIWMDLWPNDTCEIWWKLCFSHVLTFAKVLQTSNVLQDEVSHGGRLLLRMPTQNWSSHHRCSQPGLLYTGWWF